MKETLDELNEAKAEKERFQRMVLEFDMKLIKSEQNGEIVSRSRTIEEQEKILFEKMNAKKIDTAYFYSHLRDIFDYKSYIDYYKILSPCQIIDDINEIVIPDSYFYSFYIIPLAEEQKNHDWNYFKELIFYITSRDGKNVYIATFLNGGFIKDMNYRLKLGREISFFKNDILVLEDDVVQQYTKGFFYK